MAYAGSSPHGRGTPGCSRSPSSSRRFIPARAGNATPAPSSPRTSSVHPRTGGERPPVRPRMNSYSGSSPHGRGTHPSVAVGQPDGRFIPARAGNASPSASHRGGFTVHPRTGGERQVGPDGGIGPAGSSPHGRGTLRQPRNSAAFLRFIPARAGNASRPPRPGPAWSVHPRTGGERLCPVHSTRIPPGSSPHGRGTRAKPERVRY